MKCKPDDLAALGKQMWDLWRSPTTDPVFEGDYPGLDRLGKSPLWGIRRDRRRFHDNKKAPGWGPVSLCLLSCVVVAIIAHQNEAAAHEIINSTKTKDVPPLEYVRITNKPEEIEIVEKIDSAPKPIGDGTNHGSPLVPWGFLIAFLSLPILGWLLARDRT